MNAEDILFNEVRAVRGPGSGAADMRRRRLFRQALESVGPWAGNTWTRSRPAQVAARHRRVPVRTTDDKAGAL